MKNKEDLIREEVHQSWKVIREGGVILYPSDTLWGIGCDALNENAIKKIYAIKNRPVEKSLIILLHDENLLMKYVKEVPQITWDLIAYAEKPLTIIYPCAANLPALAVADDGSTAIRVVKHGFAHDLMRRLNRPLVSTSANLSGEPAPLDFSTISKAVLDGVDYVVDLHAATEMTAKHSVIMQVETNGRFKFIRR